MRSRLRRLLPFTVTSLAFFACGPDDAPPRPQWLVVVSTDAVIPLMGDRMLVELLNRDGELACSSCRREAVVAPADLWPVSFGIASPSNASEVYVKVHLYRGDRVGVDGKPVRETSIEFIGRLPSLGDGVNKVGVHLVVDCLGRSVERGESGGVVNFRTCTNDSHTQDPPMVEPPMLHGPVDHGRCGGVGTTDFMPKGRDCPAGIDYEGMACIPGGLFFLGDALAPVPAKDVLAATYPERLVATPAFLMDRYEVTTPEFRVFVESAAHPAWTDVCSEGVKCFDNTPNSKRFYCNYQRVDYESHPYAMNCVSWQLAKEYCEYRGKRLPTEAEWEYVASNGASETRYPWGDTPPRCDGAYVARGDVKNRDDATCLGDSLAGSAPDSESSWLVGDGSIRDETLPPWPVRPKEGGPVDLGPCEDPILDDGLAHTVYALAGNLSEWTADRFAPYASTDQEGEDRCWIDSKGPVLNLADLDDRTPCPPIDGKKLSVRGGSWRDSVASAWSASRNSMYSDPSTPHPEIGFRCVKDLP